MRRKSSGKPSWAQLSTIAQQQKRVMPMAANSQQRAKPGAKLPSGSNPVVLPKELAGTFEGNGKGCSPKCCILEVKPACADGLCVLRYFGCKAVPFSCEFWSTQGDNKYCDSNNCCEVETPDKDTIVEACLGYKRVSGSPHVQEMTR